MQGIVTPCVSAYRPCPWRRPDHPRRHRGTPRAPTPPQRGPAPLLGVGTLRVLVEGLLRSYISQGGGLTRNGKNRTQKHCITVLMFFFEDFCSKVQFLIYKAPSSDFFPRRADGRNGEGGGGLSLGSWQIFISRPKRRRQGRTDDLAFCTCCISACARPLGTGDRNPPGRGLGAAGCTVSPGGRFFALHSRKCFRKSGPGPCLMTLLGVPSSGSRPSLGQNPSPIKIEA